MKRIPCIAIVCLILTLSGCAVKSAADAETVCDPGSGPEPPQFCLTAELPAELQRSAEDSAEGRSVYTRADGAYEVVIETAAGAPDAVLRQLTGRETAALDPVYLACRRQISTSSRGRARTTRESLPAAARCSMTARRATL